MRLLNIGCGPHFHPSWTNIDRASTSPSVITHDIRRGLPFPDNTFDAVYHSHVIEHLRRQDAAPFLREAVRVLKPGAVMRIVTPDLETLARLYLDKLVGARDRAAGASDEYDWVMLELFDQMVRNEPGGDMAQYLRRRDLQNADFIRSRIGAEADHYWQRREGTAEGSLWRKIASRRFKDVVSILRQKIVPSLAGIIAGKDVKRALQTGFFRDSGEIHYWMYDQFSLGRSLQSAGLVDIKRCRADESCIPDFSMYDLDVVGGAVRKPDSLFMEGRKQ
jgi:SAM-dependent methyltransferase